MALMWLMQGPLLNLLAQKHGILKLGTTEIILMNHEKNGSVSLTSYICPQNMKNYIARCLQVADTDGLGSIAFPSLGTGSLGFSGVNISRVMYEEIRSFSENHPNSSLQDVTIVVYEDSVRKVQSELSTRKSCWERYFSQKYVKIQYSLKYLKFQKIYILNNSFSFPRKSCHFFLIFFLVCLFDKQEKVYSWKFNIVHMYLKCTRGEPSPSSILVEKVLYNFVIIVTILGLRLTLVMALSLV